MSLHEAELKERSKEAPNSVDKKQLGILIVKVETHPEIHIFKNQFILACFTYPLTVTQNATIRQPPRLVWRVI